MKYLNQEQLRSLLSVAYAAGERDWLILLVSYWHGLRVSEVIGLTSAHVKDGFITVKRLKGSLKTTQLLVEHQDDLLNERTALMAWSERNENRDRLFPITRQAVGQMMRKHGRVAGLPEHLCHPHVLKHSIAMHAIRKTEIPHVQQYLGHKSLASTGAYLRVSDAEASAAVQSALSR